MQWKAVGWKFRISLIFVILSCLACAVPSYAAPPPGNTSSNGLAFTWTPGALTKALHQGEATTVNITLKSSRRMTDVDLWLVPELRPFILFSPARIPLLLANESVSVQLVLMVPEKTPIGTYSGTLHVREAKRTLPQTMKFVLEVREKVAKQITGGFLHGYVYDAFTKAPISGAVVSALGVPYTTSSGPTGKFTFDTPLPGTWSLTIQKQGYTYAQRKCTVGLDRDVAVKPAYLIPEDSARTQIGPSGGVHWNSTRTIVVIIPEGALQETLEFVTTDVPRANSLPSDLPARSVFTHAQYLETSGRESVTFLKPVTVKIKNSLSFQPGLDVPVGSWDRQSLTWQDVGMAKVSADGQWIVHQFNHFSPNDWNLASRFPPQATVPLGTGGDTGSYYNYPQRELPRPLPEVHHPDLEAKDPGVGIRRGGLTVTHSLPSYRSMGVSRSLALHYDSLSVSGGAALGIETDVNPSYTLIPGAMGNIFSVAGIRKEAIFVGESGTHRPAFLFDGVNGRGEYTRTGAHPYEITPSNVYPTAYATTSSFGGPPGDSTGVATREPTPLSLPMQGSLLVENRRSSPFGAGWSMAGLEKLHKGPDGSQMLTTGDGRKVLFSANGGFETGTLSGFLRYGEAQAIRQLGLITPPEGQYMAICSNADQLIPYRYTGGLSSGYFIVPPGVTALTFSWNFLVAYDWRPITPGDSAGISLKTPNGTRSATFARGSDATLPAPGVDFTGRPYSPTLMTGWQTATIDVSDLAGTGVPVLVNFNIESGGFGTMPFSFFTYQTMGSALLVDDFRFEGATAPIYFSPSEETSAIMQNSDGTYTRLEKNGIRHLYDGDGKLTAIIDRNDNQTLFSYDLSGKLQSVRDPVGQETVLQYFGDYIQSIVDPSGRMTRFFLDGEGNLTTILNPDGSTRQFGYDSEHRMTSEVDAKGNRTLYTYEEHGRISQIIFPTGEVRSFFPSDVKGLVNDLPAGTGTQEIPALAISVFEDAVTDGMGFTTYFKTNDLGAILSQEDPLGRTTRIERNSYSDPVAIQTPDSPVANTRMGYDERRNLTEVISSTRIARFSYTGPYDQIREILGPDYVRKVLVDYDTRGNPTVISRAYGVKAIMDYDPRGLVIRSTDAAGGTTLFSYNLQGNLATITDPKGNVTYLEYDQAGNVAAVTDPEKKRTQYLYDSTNRLLQVTDAQGQVTKYVYDQNGNLISVTDARNQTTHFAYNASSLLTTVTNPLGKQKTLVYDSNRNLTQVRDFSGAITTFEYDPANQMVRKSAPDNATQMEYDANGNLTRIKDNDTDLKMTYDPGTDWLRNIETLPLPTQAAFVLTNQRELGSRDRTGLSGPGEREDVFFRDDEDRIIGQYTRPSRWSIPQATHSYGYDSLSRRIWRGSPYWYDSAYAYDSLSQLVHQSNVTPNAHFYYQYDNSGNRTQTTDQAGVHDYSYSALNQLTSAVHPNQPNEQYQYDAVGNRTSSHLSTNYRYDSANRLIENDTNTYYRDENGNLLSRQNKVTMELTDYQYDSENQLTQVTIYPNPGAPTPTAVISFRYDPFGRRIEKSVDGNIKRYIYDNEDILQEVSETGQILREYFHGPGIDEPIAMFENGQKYYFALDGLGSVVQMYDPSYNVVSSRTYDSFGNIISEAGTIKSSYAFAGREWDEETGLYYLRARYYDPTTGRFLQEDPFPGLPQSPASMHPHVYAMNNPLTLGDPFGLWTLGIGVTAQGGVLSAGPGFGYTGLLVIDGEGNAGYLTTVEGGGYYGASASASWQFQATTAPTIFDLQGFAFQGGVSGPIGEIPFSSIGGEVVIGPNYWGVNVNAGGSLGLPVEGHGMMGVSTLHYLGNINSHTLPPWIEIRIRSALRDPAVQRALATVNVTSLPSK